MRYTKCKREERTNRMCKKKQQQFGNDSQSVCVCVVIGAPVRVRVRAGETAAVCYIHTYIRRGDNQSEHNKTDKGNETKETEAATNLMEETELQKAKKNDNSKMN